MSILYPQAFLLLIWLFWIYKRKGGQRSFLLYITLILSIAALSRPVLVEQKVSQKLQGREIIIALDVSASMQAEDIVPTRLTAAKSVIRRIFTQNSHDRFALFAFTTNPLILSPFTSDHQLLISALDSLQVDNILTHGTSLEKLLKRLSRLSQREKTLLLLSDGGDIQDIDPLLALSRQGGIKIYGIATATQKGTYLKTTDNKKLKDSKGNLIISRLNPHYQALCLKSGGGFFTLEDLDETLAFIDTSTASQKSSKGYIELFWLPLLIALFLFLLHYIRIPKKLALLLPFLTLHSQSGILDWHYISQATSAYHDKQYKKAAKAFEAIDRQTMQSQLNLANSYYQLGNFTKARTIYNRLQSNDPHIKKIIFFKLGNCAYHKKQYQKAHQFYLKALRFGKDKKVLENLHLVAFKQNAQRKDFPAFHKSKEKQNSPQGSNDTKTDQKKESHSNTKKTFKNGMGSKGEGKTAKKNQSQSKKSPSSLTRPLGYKAYELINKGYIDEKKPW